jgi:hypothetical protein
MSEKIKTPKFRKPYYNLCDAIQSLKGCAGKDRELIQLLKKAEETSRDIYNHLTKKYIWD